MTTSNCGSDFALTRARTTVTNQSDASPTTRAGMRRQVLLMMLPALAFLSVAFVLMGLILSYRLAPEHRRGKHLRWLVGWTVKGLLVPSLIWFLMNIGLSLW